MRLLIILFLFASCQPKDSESIIRAHMTEQVECWNNGNIDCFMQHYWKSDSLKFIGGSGITYGWQATSDRYHKSYPDKATMGQLSFNLKHFDIIGKNSVQVIGEWKLIRVEDEPGGHFTLIWKSIEGSWVIVSDHTSSK